MADRNAAAVRGNSLTGREYSVRAWLADERHSGDPMLENPLAAAKVMALDRFLEEVRDATIQLVP